MTESGESLEDSTVMKVLGRLAYRTLLKRPRTENLESVYAAVSAVGGMA